MPRCAQIPSVHTSHAMSYQSPISPGRSWYGHPVSHRPAYPTLDGDRKSGCRGHRRRLHRPIGSHISQRLASTSLLIEAHRFGDGASGRNGGQLGTGQRSWAEEQEVELGFARAKTLFDLAEEAKAHLLEFTAANGIDMDFRPGQMSVAHKPRYVDEYKTHTELMATRFGYPHINFMDKAETAERLGSTHYYGGVRDTGTCDINPLKLLVGTATAAASAGAHSFRADPINWRPIGQWQGDCFDAERNDHRREGADCSRCLCRRPGTGHRGARDADRFVDRRYRTIAADTPPIPGARPSPIAASWSAISGNRSTIAFCSAGGRPTRKSPEDIHIHIRRQIAEIYPALKDIEIPMAGAAMSASPCRQALRARGHRSDSAGGYSGHGVMLSNFAANFMPRPSPATVIGSNCSKS